MPVEIRRQVRPSSIDPSFFAARLIGPGSAAARKCICRDTPDADLLLQQRLRLYAELMNIAHPTSQSKKSRVQGNLKSNVTST